MSENNKPALITTDTEPEVLPAEPYDFDFIVNTLGLIPYQALALDDNTTFQGAFNIGAVINLEVTEDENVALTLHGGEEILMSKAHMAELEETLRRRIEDNKAKQKEAVKDNMRIQAEAMAELQGGVAPASSVIVDGRVAKRGRFH